MQLRPPCNSRNRVRGAENETSLQAVASTLLVYHRQEHRPGALGEAGQVEGRPLQAERHAVPYCEVHGGEEANRLCGIDDRCADLQGVACPAVG